jgi:hypothetical protein
MIEVTIIQPPQITLKRKAKAGWHHSDHGQTLPINPQLPSDDRRITAKSSLP